MSPSEARRRGLRGSGGARGSGRVIAFPSPHVHADGTARVALGVVLVVWTMLVLPLVVATHSLRVGGGEGAREIAIALRSCYVPAAAALAVLGIVNYALRRGWESLSARGSVAARGAVLALVRGGVGAPARGAAPGTRWLLLAGGSMGVFLGLKGWLFARALSAGLHPTATHAGSLWFGVATLQLGAALVGACGLGWLSLRAGRGALSPARSGALQLWCVYVHVTSVLSVITFLIARAP